MKKFFALLLAAATVFAFCNISFAQWIELDEIYDVYGFGEEIYVGGKSQTEGVIVSMVDSGGNLKYYISLDAQTLEDGIYIGVDKTWETGEYILRVSYGQEYVYTHYFTVQEERVDRNPTTVKPQGEKNVITATNISVSLPEVTLELGESVQITAEGEKTSYKWVTDDDDKITMDGIYTSQAKITAKKTGKAIVWVYCGNNYSTIEINIVPSTKPKTDVKPDADKNTDKIDKTSEPDEKKDSSEKDEQTPPEADMFTDIAGEAWAKEGINALAKAGIINGMGDGIFAPDKNVTRAQFAKMIVQAFDLEGVGEASFTDVSEDAWYAQAVLVAANNAIVNGYDGRFNPEENISCRDAALIISRVLEKKNIKLGKEASAEKFEEAQYAAEAVRLLAGNGIITDEMGFDSLKNATRAQSAYLIYEAYKLK